MKRLGFFMVFARQNVFVGLAIIALTLISVSPANAQFTSGYNPKLTAMDGNGITLSYAVTVDSLQADTTKAFQVGLYDDDLFTTYPIMVGYKTTSAAAKPHVSMVIQGSYGDGVWAAVDTIVANDSLEAYAQTSLDLNSKKYPYYRIIFTGLANSGDGLNNRADSYAILTLYFYRKGY